MKNFIVNIADKFPDYLNDESNMVTNGRAERLYFPKTEQEASEIIAEADEKDVSVTISGGGTGISGGRVPLKGWIIATEKMNTISSEQKHSWVDPETGSSYEVMLEEIDQENAVFHIPISMTVKSIQNYVREKNWFYPPDPTERSSFIGGNVSTNASGARSFKFKATREWIHGISVILASGEVIRLSRDQKNGSIDDEFITLEKNEMTINIPRPKYGLPKVSKHVAGPVITDLSHPLDIFVGTNGIFGMVSQVSIRLIRPPTHIISIFAYCESVSQAFSLILGCQKMRALQTFPVPMSVEFFDERAISIMAKRDSRINTEMKSLLMIEQDIYEGEDLDEILEYWSSTLEKLGISDVDVAQTHREIEHHKFLRHWVPEYIIGLNRSFGQSLVVTDYSVPEQHYKEFFDYLIDVGEAFITFQKGIKPLVEGNPGYSLFGHAGDCHPHLTMLPRNAKEADYCQQKLIEILEKTVQLGGSIASEHGLGKKLFSGKLALFYQYGQIGIDEVIAMKYAIDPKGIMCPDNLIRL